MSRFIKLFTHFLFISLFASSVAHAGSVTFHQDPNTQKVVSYTIEVIKPATPLSSDATDALYSVEEGFHSVNLGIATVPDLDPLDPLKRAATPTSSFLSNYQNNRLMGFKPLDSDLGHLELPLVNTQNTTVGLEWTSELDPSLRNITVHYTFTYQVNNAVSKVSSKAVLALDRHAVIPLDHGFSLRIKPFQLTTIPKALLTQDDAETDHPMASR